MVYSGAVRHVTWNEAWGPEGEVQVVGGNSVLQPGVRGGRDGGGLLIPAGSKPGDRVWFGNRVVTSSATFRVKVEYTLRQGPHGLEVSDQTVVPWR